MIVLGVYSFLSPLQHSLQLGEACGDSLFQFVQVGKDLGGGGVLHGYILGFLILVDGQVIAVFYDLFLGDEEGFGGAGVFCFVVRLEIATASVRTGFAMTINRVEAGDDVGDIVILDLRALIVQGESVGGHIVEPDLVRAAVARLGENQNAGGHARIGLEHTAGHGDHGLQPVALHQLLPDGLVGSGRTEEDTIGNDAGATAAGFQHPQEQRQKQQFRFFRLADFQQVSGHGIRIQATLEGGVGKNQIELLLIRVLVGQAIDYSPHYPVSTKIALNIGIKSAKHDFIVNTSSDATPVSNRWLSLLAKGFMYGDIVLGYSGMAREGGFKNFIFREFQFNESVGWLAAAIRRRAYSASRSALGFKKSLYFDARGFNHLNMNVGENDLFVQQIATKNNVSVVLSPRAVCTERIWGGWGWWWRRLKLLQTTHRYYPKGALVPIIAELTTRTLFFTAILTALIFMPWEFKMATLVVALLRYFVVMFTMVRNAGRLGETGLAATHFIYDIIEPVLRFILAFSSYKKYKKSWL